MYPVVYGADIGSMVLGTIDVAVECGGALVERASS